MARKTIRDALKRNGGGGSESTASSAVSTYNLNAREKLADAGIDDPTAEQTPSALERIFGVADVFGTGIRGLAYNAVSDKNVDVLGEMGKAWSGEERVEGADILKKLGSDNDIANLVGGLAVDILLDPLTYLTFGFGAAAKAGGRGALTALAKGDDIAKALKAAGAADDVIDTTRATLKAKGLVDDAGKLVSGAVDKLSKGDSQEVMTALYKAASGGKGGGVKMFGKSLGGEKLVSNAGYKAKGALRAVPGSTWVEQAFGMKGVPGNVIESVRDGNEVANVLRQGAVKEYVNKRHLGDAIAARIGKEMTDAIPDTRLRSAVTRAMAEQFSDESLGKIANRFDDIQRWAGNRRQAVKDMLSRAGVNVGKYEGDDAFEQAIDEVLRVWDEAATKAKTVAEELSAAQREARGIASWMKQSQGRPKHVSDAIDKSYKGYERVPDTAYTMEMPNESLISELKPEQVAKRDTAIKRAKGLWKGSDKQDDAIESVDDLWDEASEYADEYDDVLSDSDASRLVGVKELAATYGFNVKEGSQKNLQAFISWLSKESEAGRVDPEDVKTVREYLYQLREAAKYRGGYHQTGMGISTQAPGRLRQLSDEIRSLARQLGADTKKARGLESAVERYYQYDNALQQAIGGMDELRTELFDPGAIGRVLSELGFSPQEIAAAENVVRRYTQEMATTRTARASAGLDAKDFMGEGANSLGYIFSTAPVKRSAKEAEKRVADLKSLGLDVENLRQVEPEAHRGVGLAQGSKSYNDPIRAMRGVSIDDLLRQEKGIPRETPKDVVGGIDRELDIAAITEKKLSKDADDIALKELTDTLAAIDGEEVAKQTAQRLHSFFTDDEATKGILKTLDTVLNFWKRQATIMRFPAFQGRNGLSNKIMMAQDGGLSLAGEAKSVRVIKQMMEADKGKLPPEELAKLNKTLDELIHSGVITTFEEVSEQVGKGSLGSKPTQLLGKVNTVIENQSRISAYFTFRGKGMSPAAAGEMVNKTMLDYSDEALTVFERNFMKRLIPFYKWIKGNTSKQLRVLVESPGKSVWLGHLKESGEATTDYDKSVMPQYLRDLYPIPLPLTDDGDHIMLSTSGLFPQGDLEILSGILSGKFDLRDAFGSLTPLLRTPLELIANRDIFYGTDIEMYEGQKKRAPGWLETFGDLASQVEGLDLAWEIICDTFGVQERETDDGDAYYYVSGKAVKAMRDLVPWMNQVGKVLSDERRTKYDRVMAATGLKPILYDTEKFASDKEYADRATLRDALSKLKDEESVVPKRTLKDILGVK